MKFKVLYKRAYSTIRKIVVDPKQLESNLVNAGLTPREMDAWLNALESHKQAWQGFGGWRNRERKHQFKMGQVRLFASGKQVRIIID